MRQASAINVKCLVNHDEMEILAPLGWVIQTGSGSVVNVAQEMYVSIKHSLFNYTSNLCKPVVVFTKVVTYLHRSCIIYKQPLIIYICAVKYEIICSHKKQWRKCKTFSTTVSSTRMELLQKFNRGHSVELDELGSLTKQDTIIVVRWSWCILPISLVAFGYVFLLRCSSGEQQG